ncbi:MAG: ComEA family DNA-binding protein [Patescibacteria group bacterium]
MNRWIFVGSLGAVFLITLGFSYGPGYGGRLLAFLGANTTTSPKMSPNDMVTPMVTLKQVVTLKNVTNVTSMSPVVSPTMSPLIYDNNQYVSVSPSVSPSRTPTSVMSPSPVTFQPVASPSLTETSSPTPLSLTPLSSPTPTVTPIPTSSPQSTKININTASYIELQEIPEVGTARAQYIINYRNANGPFQKIEDIMMVKDIKTARFQKMKDYITVE